MARSNQSVIASRYRIVSLLGEGGFGAVYLAEDTRLGNKKVALKESFDNSSEAQEQFRLEAQLLANLQHNNLPRVTDNFIETDGCQFLVMDFIEGDDLADRLTQTNCPMAEMEAVRLMCQITEAVAYLHTRQPEPIIHRDIKLSNIKITRTGQAMLVDFGIAKVYHPKKATAKVAKAVSPHFSPPEQYISKTDTRSDVYALAATLYCLVTAQPPMDAMDRLTKGDQLVPPSQHNPAVSPALEKIIMTAMSLDPNQRYKNANHFFAALNGFLNGQAYVPAVNAQVSSSGLIDPFRQPQPDRFCPQCGRRLRAGARFCPVDGTPLHPAPQPVRQVPQMGLVTPQPVPPQLDPKMQFEVANAFFKKSEYAEALVRYQACLQNGYQQPVVYENMALCYFKLDKEREALQALEQGMRQFPNIVEFLYDKALVLRAVSRPTEALDCARQMCQKGSSDPDFYSLYGELLLDDNQVDEAITQFKKAVSLNSKSAEYLIWLGRAYGIKGNLRSAVTELNKAAALEPDNPTPHFWMGVFNKNEKKYSQAIKCFETALKREPKLHLAYYFIGECYLMQDNHQKAYQNYSKALSMYDKDPDYFVGLAVAAAMLGNRSEARTNLNRALALDPNHRLAQELLSKL